MRVLIFDTETTGLPPKSGITDQQLLTFSQVHCWNEVIHSWPYILQLSYIVFDTESNTIEKTVNQYVDIRRDIHISKQSIAVHKITYDSIQNSENKTNISTLLSDFMIDVYSVELCIGHNVNFDRKMIIAELIRNNLPWTDILTFMDKNRFYCTMDKTKEKCNLRMEVSYTNRSGKLLTMNKIKMPKLSESHKHFFGYAPDEKMLHDAFMDVVICLRVFMINEYNKDIYEGGLDAHQLVRILWSPLHPLLPLSSLTPFESTFGTQSEFGTALVVPNYLPPIESFTPSIESS